MKKTLIVANWKMNLNTSQASLLLHRLQEKIKIHRNVEVVLAPSHLLLQPLSMQIDRRKFRLSAQDGYYKDEGAFTGEVSFAQMRDLVHYSIIGHSERRVYHNESLELIRDKVAACVRNEITPIICVGETHNERKNGETRQVLHDQVSTAISHVTSKEVEGIVIAYEPVWAISTFGGQTAKPDDVQKELAFIRRQITDLFGKKTANRMRILYGGSVDDHSVGSYLQLQDCDGALVGGASLNYHKFAGIVAKAFELTQIDDK